MSDQSEGTVPFTLPAAVRKRLKGEKLPAGNASQVTFGSFHDTIDSTMRTPTDVVDLWRNQIPELGPTFSTISVLPFHNPGLDAAKLMNGFQLYAGSLDPAARTPTPSMVPQDRKRNPDLWPVGLAPAALARPGDRGVAKFVRRADTSIVTSEKVEKAPVRSEAASTVNSLSETALSRGLKKVKEELQKAAKPPLPATPPPITTPKKTSFVEKASSTLGTVSELAKAATGGNENFFTRALGSLNSAVQQVQALAKPSNTGPTLGGGGLA